MGTEIIKARLSVERLNQMAQTQPERLIAEAEAGYFDRLSEISAHIRQNRERCKIILLAGPSGSGKTTTASKLREQLQGEGIESVYVSLDNFFLNRDDLPLLPDGMPDFESIRTLDM
ncbi:MAG: AAA family ATPase, partial [Oscillospiraceae bacterium]|nr:AAA family ATPase [Oscillospiraceae bacterium]